MPVACPHREPTATTRRRCRTALGYRRFNCCSCRRRLNERTSTAFNDLQHPTDFVLLAVMWRPRVTLSFRDAAELLLQCGFGLYQISDHGTLQARDLVVLRPVVRLGESRFPAKMAPDFPSLSEF